MSRTVKRQKKATYDDILKLPENMIGEIIDGELFVSPRPNPQHALVATNLPVKLVPFFGRGGTPGGRLILVEPELHLGSDPNDQVFVPDLAGWKKDRMPTLPKEAHITIVPDWICEILSPSNARVDRIIKVPKYASLGVGHLWLINPKEKTLDTFRLEDGKWMLFQSFIDSDKVRAEPFEAIEFDLGALWE